MRSPRHFLDTRHVSARQWQELFDRADELRTASHSPLAGAHWVLWFEEVSTRTVLSFARALQAYGGASTQFNPDQSSLSKGESATQTLQVLASQGISGMVIRTSHPGLPHHLATHSPIPVVNAGDGWHQHPTQALGDLYTLAQYQPLDNLHMLIVGDIKHSRVARSHIAAAHTLGIRLSLAGPRRFHINLDGLDHVSWVDDWEASLPHVHAVMMVRTQAERLDPAERIGDAEYRRGWGLTAGRAELLRRDAWILHPGPARLGVEIDAVLMEDRRLLMKHQVNHGVLTRAALLWSLAQ